MPYTRKTPWVHIYGRGTVKGEHAKDDFGYALKQFGLELSSAFYIWEAVLLAATHPTEPLSEVERLGVFANEANAYGTVRDFTVLGRVTHFKAKWMEMPKHTTGVLAYDGVDFYIAPNANAAKSMIESLTVRDGGERPPTPREVVRYYELGAYVVRLLMGKGSGDITLGRLWADGTFTPLQTPSKNEAMLFVSGLDVIEDICMSSRRGLGEPCYRMVAQDATAELFAAFPDLKNLHGLALAYDKDGVVLGRRLEFKHGSILPALGGLGASGRRGAPRTPRGTAKKWHAIGPEGAGGRVSYGKIPHREFEVTLEFENERGGTSHTKRYAQTFRRDRGFFDVRLYDPAPGGGWRENFYERSTRATNHEAAVKRVATARFARTERHIVVVDVKPLDQRPSGVGGLGFADEKPKLHTHVETKWQRGGEKQCVVHFAWPGGQHREPVGPISSYADEREVVRRALVTARPRIEQKVRS